MSKAARRLYKLFALDAREFWWTGGHEVVFD
jgi:hypothetical protein